MSEPISAMSLTADFYPGIKEGESIENYDGNSIEWTFAMPRNTSFGAGVYEIRFVRNLNEEEAPGYPVLGGQLNTSAVIDNNITRSTRRAAMARAKKGE